MQEISLLEKMRNERHVTPFQAAAFLGVSLGSYWDLEWHDDEPWSLTIIELMRLCILYETLPVALLPEDAFRDGKKQVEFVYDEYGITAIASTLLGYCGDTFRVAEAIGWKHEAVDLWLSDENAIGTMPLPALNALCRYLDINISDVLNGFWSALGRSLDSA